MNVLSQPVRRGGEIYHTAASACRYLGISKSKFFIYRRAGMICTEAVLAPEGKMKLLYAQSKLDRVFRPVDLLTAVQTIENNRKKS